MSEIFVRLLDKETYEYEAPIAALAHTPAYGFGNNIVVNKGVVPAHLRTSVVVHELEERRRRQAGDDNLTAHRAAIVAEYRHAAERGVLEDQHGFIRSILEELRKDTSDSPTIQEIEDNLRYRGQVYAEVSG